MTYEVQIYTLCDGWTNTWNIIAEDGTETPETFDTAAQAQAALDEFLAEIQAEIEAGQREPWESYDREEFRIVPAGGARCKGEQHMTHTTKHTPGPWVVNADGHMIEAQLPNLRNEYEHICDLRGGIKGQINLGNAQLIAAAPAMYEALQQSLVLIELAALEEWGRAVRGEQQPPTTEARDRLENVRAALAQAEGRTL